MTGLRPKSTCWIVTDGRAGIRNQALGLAESIARKVPLELIEKKVRLASPWNSLPTALAPSFAAIPSKESDRLASPLPDLWIGCGRQAALFSIAMGRKKARPFIVQLQNPRAPLDRFDLVIPPFHDGLSGENVISTLGSLNRINRDQVPIASIDLNERLSGISIQGAAKRQTIGVLIGGPNSIYHFTDQTTKELCDIVEGLVSAKARIVVSTSRRTPPECVARLKASLSKEVLVFDPNDPCDIVNPYPDMLFLSNYVLVTQDSVNMISEAATAGVRTHVLKLPTRRAKAHKFDVFLDEMIARGLVRIFDGTLPEWSPPLFDETKRAAEEVCARWEHSGYQHT